MTEPRNLVSTLQAGQVYEVPLSGTLLSKPGIFPEQKPCGEDFRRKWIEVRLFLSSRCALATINLFCSGPCSWWYTNCILCCTFIIWSKLFYAVSNVFSIIKRVEKNILV